MPENTATRAGVGRRDALPFARPSSARLSELCRESVAASPATMSPSHRLSLRHGPALPRCSGWKPCRPVTHEPQEAAQSLTCYGCLNIPTNAGQTWEPSRSPRGTPRCLRHEQAHHTSRPAPAGTDTPHPRRLPSSSISHKPQFCCDLVSGSQEVPMLPIPPPPGFSWLKRALPHPPEEAWAPEGPRNTDPCHGQEGRAVQGGKEAGGGWQRRRKWPRQNEAERAMAPHSRVPSRLPQLPTAKRAVIMGSETRGCYRCTDRAPGVGALSPIRTQNTKSPFRWDTWGWGRRQRWQEGGQGWGRQGQTSCCSQRQEKPQGQRRQGMVLLACPEHCQEYS